MVRDIKKHSNCHFSNTSSGNVIKNSKLADDLSLSKIINLNNKFNQDSQIGVEIKYSESEFSKFVEKNYSLSPELWGLKLEKHNKELVRFGFAYYNSSSLVCFIIGIRNSDASIKGIVGDKKLFEEWVNNYNKFINKKNDKNDKKDIEKILNYTFVTPKFI